MDEFESKLLARYDKEEKEKPKDDEHDIFCSSLAPKLRRLSEINPREASNLEFDISKMFHDYEQKFLFTNKQD